MASRTVGDGEVQPGKEQGPASLSGVEPSSFPEVLEILVIGDDREIMIYFLQPMPPLF